MGKIEAASFATASANIRAPPRHAASGLVDRYFLSRAGVILEPTGCTCRSGGRPERNAAGKRLWAARHSPGRPMVDRFHSRTIGLAASAQQAGRDRVSRHVEGPVVPLLPQEFLVRPGLVEAAVHEDDDRRLRWDGVIPVRGEDDDPVLQFGEELEDGALTLGVEARDWLVQDHDRCVLVDEP